MRVLVGLGNPGPEHARQRHNVGFMALDAIAARLGASPWKKQFQGLTAEARSGAEKLLLLKPQTYMNDSGRSAAAALGFYKLGPEALAVFHDELDLVPGKVRVKIGGGAAGHNGLRSLDAHLGPDYPRVRLGIGHPGHKDRVLGYVLGDFAKADQDWLPGMLDAVAEALPELLAGELERFQTKVALKTAPP